MINTKKILCTVCNKKFHPRGYHPHLKIHKNETANAHADTKTENPPTPVSDHHCPKCGKDLVTPHGLSLHILNCKRRNTTTTSAIRIKRGKNPRSIQRNSKIFPMRDGLFCCPFCDHTSTRAPGIVMHCKGSHKDEYEKFRKSLGHSAVKTKTKAKMTIPNKIGAMRGQMQKKVLGYNLQSMSFDELINLKQQLNQVIDHIKKEAEQKYRQLIND